MGKYWMTPYFKKSRWYLMPMIVSKWMMSLNKNSTIVFPLAIRFPKAKEYK
jgi:hypothetical protein